MTRPNARAALVVALLVGAPLGGPTACAPDAPPTAPDAALSASVVAVSPELLGAVADAEARVLPALDATARARVGPALAELRRALERGDASRARRAAAALRGLDGSADADLVAIALLGTVAEERLGIGDAR